jgi:serine/threonine protein kinase
MTPQSTIGHYRITSKLEEGGMGEVWRATDTKLGRDVAIKVLPESFAADADRMARFEREAKVLASLNHPNIAQIYGIEDRALVMELVEGETLHGPLAHCIRVYDVRRETETPLTFGGGYGFPVWSADGRYLVLGGTRAMVTQQV